MLVAALQCLVLASHQFASGKTYRLFQGLFIGVAVYLVNALLFWSGAQSHIFVYLSVLVVGFVIGPILYMLARNEIESLKFESKLLLHFIPVAIYPFYLLALYFSLSDSAAYAASHNFSVLWYDPLHVALMMAMLATQLTYSVLSVRLLLSNAFDAGAGKTPEENQTKLSWYDIVSASPLLMLALGLSIYFGWGVLSFLLSLIFAGEQVVSVAGTISNFGLYILLSKLNISSVAMQKSGGEKEENKDLDQGKDPYRTEQVERIVTAMEESKLYLNPELTLEQLAEQTRIQPRLVSTIINRRFNKNFFEFTNSYRVNHAKNLLRTSDKGVSMLDIMADSGFNSKSAFNRFFKKYTEMTPTQYRQMNRKK